MDISMQIVWLIAAVVFGVLELVTTSLTSIWFVFGAVVSMIAALFSAPMLIQIIIFIIVSAVSLWFTRPLAMKYLNSRTVKTNVDSLVGRILIAKTEIDNLKMSGKADLDGSTWIAVSSDDSIIAAGEEIEVVKVEGAKLIVKKKEAGGK
ncbi:Membrane protein implicated in regulation of membrane protease activity [Butyrivibrio proteoclasticus]|uniref:Membrane protein implicated in regulation of membrane protease activity n=1 Tax=Butyrivibrio proteoclasticus TaxID=43305 RepID=A0A1I5QA85_9FIRM|nr:NfeD family protein [Butyrivibrio proteoclasticus]SFP42951.1 Membrane protein implicated in regulation of membrane protease activity [Butyrivibrio proteoclasticus]